MSDYTKLVDYAAKDALLSGNPAKLVKGTELGAEFDAIQTAISTKLDEISGVLTTPQINDTSGDHQYIFAVSELAADRTVTLPLLTGNDTFVFQSHTQTITNKTIDLTDNTVTGTQAEFNTAVSDGQFVFSDTDTGAALIPVGTTGQRPTGADGKIRFNSTTGGYEGYKNGNWLPLGGGATGGGTDDVFYENSITVTTNYTLSAGKNASSIGPITINSGVSVTVGTGQRWVVL